MKKIQIRVSSLMSRACAMGLALLGFASCTELTNEDEDILAMYGCPTGTFEIKGAVTAEGSNAPVSDAVVVLKSSREGVQLIPEAESDSKGEYRLEGSGFPEEKVRVVCTPASESGLEADSVDIKLSYEKDGKTVSAWNAGNAKSTVNFKLKAKKTNE